MLENETRRFRCCFKDNIVQFDDIGAAKECLKDLGLSINLLSADWLEDFNNALLIVNGVCAKVDLTVLTTT